MMEQLAYYIAYNYTQRPKQNFYPVKHIKYIYNTVIMRSFCVLFKCFEIKCLIKPFNMQCIINTLIHIDFNKYFIYILLDLVIF